MSDLPHIPGDALTPSAATPSHQAAAPRSVRVAVITVSDTRTPETDESGAYLVREIAANGHQLVKHVIVKDDGIQIRTLLTGLLRECDLILTTGGTGIAGRDVTIPVVESLMVKHLPGFGEVFRMLSYQQVRGAAMLSRATAGLTRGALIFAMPGSLNAVQTAWEGILRDQLGHLVFEVARQGQPMTDVMRPEVSAIPTAAIPETAAPSSVQPVAPESVTVLTAAPEVVTVQPINQPGTQHINQGASAGLGRHTQPSNSFGQGGPEPLGRHRDK